MTMPRMLDPQIAGWRDGTHFRVREQRLELDPTTRRRRHESARVTGWGVLCARWRFCKWLGFK